MEKACTRCGETKPLEEFVRDKRCKDGRTARCKVCTNAQLRAAHARRMEDPAYREHHAARSREWCAANPAAANAKSKRWKDKNPEKVYAIRKAWEAANPEYFREWYRKNAEKERARSRLVMRKFREQHPERAREIAQRYRATHLETVRRRERENTHRRRALMGSSSPELAEHMARLLQEPCDYCGATDNMTIDHVVPLARGGKHEATNLAPACVSCNSSKGAKTLEEWLTF